MYIKLIDTLYFICMVTCSFRFTCQNTECTSLYASVFHLPHPVSSPLSDITVGLQMKQYQLRSSSLRYFLQSSVVFNVSGRNDQFLFPIIAPGNVTFFFQGEEMLVLLCGVTFHLLCRVLTNLQLQEFRVFRSASSFLVNETGIPNCRSTVATVSPRVIKCFISIVTAYILFSFIFF